MQFSNAVEKHWQQVALQYYVKINEASNSDNELFLSLLKNQ